jgi:hypothetical protein
MPRLSKDFKTAISEIPADELQKLVLQAASKSQEIYDWINIHYVDKKEAKKQLFIETKDKALGEVYGYRDHRIIQKSLAKAIGNAVKHINYYAKITNDFVGEAEVLNSILTFVFERFADDLGTCWTVFDSKLAVTTNRFYNLVTKKLHEDYRIEYHENLNRCLEILHAKSNHLDYIYNMPKSIE